MHQSHVDCLIYLEKVRWKGIPTCPYCGSRRSSACKKEQRYHCNDCFTSYSVTVGTLFHKTHVDLRKWFDAIELLYRLNGNISARKLSQILGVSRAAALSMIDRVECAIGDDVAMLDAIRSDRRIES
jgi:transposase-like protein